MKYQIMTRLYDLFSANWTWTWQKTRKGCEDAALRSAIDIGFSNSCKTQERHVQHRAFANNNKQWTKEVIFFSARLELTKIMVNLVSCQNEEWDLKNHKPSCYSCNKWQKVSRIYLFSISSNKLRRDVGPRLCLQQGYFFERYIRVPLNFRFILDLKFIPCRLS